MPGFEPGTSGLWDRRADHCSTPQYINKTFHLLHLFPISFSGLQSMYQSSISALIIHWSEGGCLELHAYEIAVVIFQHLSCLQDYEMLIFLKGLRPLCRHPATKRLRMRGIYCSLNPIFIKELLLQCWRGSNPRHLPWQGSTLTNWATALGLNHSLPPGVVRDQGPNQMAAIAA